MRRLIPTFLLLVLAVRPGAAAPAAAPLTLARALELAHVNQPDVKVARASALKARAAADGTRSGRLPTLDANASYDLSAGSSEDPSVPRDLARLGLSANWMLWDFGQTGRRVGISDASAAAAAADARQAELDLDLAVRSAYFATGAARRLVDVARDTLANEQRHLQQIEAFVEVGRRPEIDRYQARTQVANARVALIQAENLYDEARAQLARAVGDPAVAELELADESMPAVTGEDAGDDALYAQALKSRPDLAALAQQRRAAQLGIDVSRGAYLPEIRLGAGLDGTALDGDPTWGWSAGVTLSWRLYDGGARRADVRGAQADLLAVDARAEGLAQDVRVEIRKARLAVRAAKAAQSAADEALANAKKQLELAEARYAEGVGSAIELGDAQVAMSDASTQVVLSAFDLSTARAQLLHALGE